MTAIVIIEGVVIVLLIVLVAGLLKSHAEILRQLHALGAGADEPEARAGSRPQSTGLTKAPVTELIGLDPQGAGRTISLEHGRGNTLLAFLSSGCASCVSFWEELSGQFEPLSDQTRTVIVTRGPASESSARIGELAPSDIPLVMSDEVWDSFRVPVTPFFVLIDEKARLIGEGSTTSWKRLLGMFRQSTADLDRSRMGTVRRQEHTDSALIESGVEPGDASLFQNPLEQ